MKKLAVHLHLCYTEQMPEVLTYLRHLKGEDYDLFVTMVTEDNAVAEKIKAEHPTAVIWHVANYGHDIGPFIDFLNKIDLADYKYILKVYTKGNTGQNYNKLNGVRFDNALWGKVLWDSQLANVERLRTNLDILERSSGVGMVCSKYCLTDAKQDYEKLLPQINAELQKLKLPTVTKLSFVAGSMFLARAELFSPLKMYRLEDFRLSDDDSKEGIPAYVAECLLGAVVTLQGYAIRSIRHGGYGRRFCWVAFKRFLFQKKQTKHGLLIKLFKIPVYYHQQKDNI